MTSKFFKSNVNPSDEPTDNVKENIGIGSEIIAEENETIREVPKAIQQNAFSAMMMNSKVIELDVEQDMVSSPKKPKVSTYNWEVIILWRYFGMMYNCNYYS